MERGKLLQHHHVTVITVLYKADHLNAYITMEKLSLFQQFYKAVPTILWDMVLDNYAPKKYTC